MYEIGHFVEMKKPHACTMKATGKKANCWEITRVGADIKIRCTNCEHLVMMSRHDFERKMKKIIDQMKIHCKCYCGKLICIAEDQIQSFFLFFNQKWLGLKKSQPFCFYLSSSNLPSLTSL